MEIIIIMGSKVARDPYMKSKDTQGSLIMGHMLVDRQETWDTTLER